MSTCIRSPSSSSPGRPTGRGTVRGTAEAGSARAGAVAGGQGSPGSSGRAMRNRTNPDAAALAWSWSSLGRWPVTLRILWFRTLVRDGERDAGALARPLDTDRRRGRRVPGRVREQVAEHLGDALGVGHRPRQVGPEVDEDGVPAATGQERGAGPVDERGNIRGLGRDGERSRLDAPCIE